MWLYGCTVVQLCSCTFVLFYSCAVVQLYSYRFSFLLVMQLYSGTILPLVVRFYKTQQTETAGGVIGATLPLHTVEYDAFINQTPNTKSPHPKHETQGR